MEREALALKRRKTPPMPVELLANHPKALGMNGAAFGHLMRLALHFWLTDCKPLPVVDNQLYVLARAFPATWKANRDDIKAVLQDVIPELKAARELYDKRRSILGQMRDRAMSSATSKRYKKAIVETPAIGSAYRPQVEERNRAPAPLAQVKSAGSGFVEKPR